MSKKSLVDGKYRNQTQKRKRWPSRPPDLLDLDKQLPVARTAGERTVKIHTPIPTPKAVEANAGPGDELTPEIARPVFDLEPVSNIS
jgi:hypothetical protein